jgi:hypothetical protein
MRELGLGLRASADGNGYLERWGEAILDWCELFDELT